MKCVCNKYPFSLTNCAVESWNHSCNIILENLSECMFASDDEQAYLTASFQAHYDSSLHARASYKSLMLSTRWRFTSAHFLLEVSWSLLSSFILAFAGVSFFSRHKLTGMRRSLHSSFWFKNFRHVEGAKMIILSKCHAKCTAKWLCIDNSRIYEHKAIY